MSDTFERRVECSPGHWHRDEGKTDYGIGSVRMWFYLIGPKGAVQWQIGTEWYPPKAREGLMSGGRWADRERMMKPTGWDLGYHSPRPMYEDQTLHGKCSVIGGECFYDGSGLNADLLIEGFIAGGTDWLWPKLEEYYRHTFEGAPWPDFSAPIVPHPDDVKAAKRPASAPSDIGKQGS